MSSPMVLAFSGRWYLDICSQHTEADHCRRQKIVITTFMLATDTMLTQFVEKLTQINRGRAFYSSPDRLGEYILADYIRNRRKFVH